MNVLLRAAALVLLVVVTTADAATPKIILDTDMTGDCDDLGALAMTHALADNGEIEFLGVIGSYGGVPYVAGCIDAVNTYYGRGDLPIGAEPEAFGRTESFYLEPIASDQARYGHDVVKNTDVPDHVTVYRQLLAGQPDASVTIVTVGRLKGLSDLLASPADAISELDGKALVAKKALQWVCMGGYYPNTEHKKEANFATHGGAPYSQKAVEAWPPTLPVVFTGFEIGIEIETGMEVIKQGDDNPVARGYRIWFEGALGKNKPWRRASWDQTAVLYAARGAEPWWDIVSTGHNAVQEDGANEWLSSPDKDHKYLVKRAEPAEVTTIIIELMSQPPKSR
jgi:hypothetical protein